VSAAVARLLIVDDESAQMRALCDTLVLEGYITHGFSSAQQALTELRPGQFDLLLTDLMMPEMDGITLINAARQIDSTLGAVVMTGHGTIDTAVQAMQVGALDYILKPFRLNVILPVISRALDVQRLRRENAELQARELRRSEELAAAYQALEAFSYSISHDLRAPLRTIDSFAQVLEDEFAQPLGEEGRRVIGIIRRGSQKMDQLIVGLLEFSRVGRERLELDRIDMTALADAAAAEAMAAYTGPKPQIDIAELPEAAGDATVMRQVWCNLIGNALKYSAKRPEPRIRKPSIRWRTMGPVSTCATRTSFSESSSGCTVRRSFPEPGWDSRSCNVSSCATADAYGRRAHPMQARAFSSRCRSRQRKTLRP
jgi:FixJ family two-component response regulator